MKLATGLALTIAISLPALAETRLPTIPPSQYTADQKSAAESFLAARKKPVFGPFEPLMYSPEVMTLARSMGDYLRFKSGIGNTLSELAILVTAREWSQNYEWQVHAPIAAETGIKPEIIDAIRDGRRPVGLSEDEAIVYDFSTELHRNKRVSDTTFARAETRLANPQLSISSESTATTRFWPCNSTQLAMRDHPAEQACLASLNSKSQERQGGDSF